MLRIDKSILAPTLITPSKLPLGEGQAGPQTRTLTLRNNSTSPITYNLSFVNALSTGGVITPSFFTSNATVSFSASSVTVPAGGTATVNVTINPATSPTNGQYGGYIVFTPTGGGQVLRVPFAGFVGDYQGIVHMPPTSFGFPWLARLVGGVFYQQGPGAVFTLQGDDVPYFLVHLSHQARRVRAEVYDANTNWYWRRAFSYDYVPRNSTTTSFFAFPWDGLTFSGDPLVGNTIIVPDGDYYIVIQVLKALGDPMNSADWETWTSPVFTIDRP
ncbi:MAG: Fn3-like domain-containing protein [Caldilineales bacterium]|nr:Fn3-like domain-containing protein [Caldilineales bacterium]